MRTKLVAFIVLLAAAGLTLGWKVAHDPACFIGGLPASTRLSGVPHRGGLALPPEVRVNLTGAPISQIKIAIDAPYTVTVPGAENQSARGEAAGALRVARLPKGFRVGDREFRGDSLEIAADRSPAIWVEEHQYRGCVRFFGQAAGQMLVVNVLPLEEYVASVVDGEMPADFPTAARQAQAIVARSYVVYQMRKAKSSPFFDVHATTRSQNYLGYQYRGRDGRRYAAESPSAQRVAEQTAGMICLCDGEPFCTYYTAVCGGRTAGGETVFNDSASALKSVTCESCKDADLYRWTRELPLQTASTALVRHFTTSGKRFGNLVSIRRVLETESVNAAAFEISDGRRRQRISPIEFRRLFPSASIPSYQFEPRVAGMQLVIEGRGHGHGVGLCQWGARGMALADSGPLDIIRHYYPGAEVVAAK